MTGSRYLFCGIVDGDSESRILYKIYMCVDMPCPKLKPKYQFVFHAHASQCFWGCTCVQSTRSLRLRFLARESQWKLHNFLRHGNLLGLRLYIPQRKCALVFALVLFKSYIHHHREVMSISPFILSEVVDQSAHLCENHNTYNLHGTSRKLEDTSRFNMVLIHIHCRKWMVSVYMQVV